MSESGNAGFYRYDLTDKTIQRYFEQSAEGNTQTLELQDVTERYNNLVDDYNIVRVLLAAVGVVAVVLLILLILSRKGRGRKNEEEYDAYAQLDEKPERKEKKAKKEFRKNGRKLSQEERYMMGEEDDYEENYEPEQETEPCIRDRCYTLGDAYTLDYWKDIAKRIEDMGADSICIKAVSYTHLPNPSA